MERCPICGNVFKTISWKHLKYKHDISIESFKKTYGYAHKLSFNSGETRESCEAVDIGTKRALEAKIKNGYTFEPWNLGKNKNNDTTLFKMSKKRKGFKNPVFKKAINIWSSLESIKMFFDKCLKVKKTLPILENIGEYNSLMPVVNGKFGDGFKNGYITAAMKYYFNINKKNTTDYFRHAYKFFYNIDYDEYSNNIRYLKARKTKSTKEYKDKASKLTTLMHKNGRYGHTDTSIQKKIRLFLSAENIYFEEEYNLLYYSGDFYVPKKNIIIEAFGDYWHCNPKKYSKDYFNKNWNKTAEEIWKRDAKRKSYIESIGYHVIILWEEDIINNFDYVKETINEACKN